MTNPEALQLTYYRDTAKSYDQWHTLGFDEHHFALEHIVFYLKWIAATSVLDTGCGTGRAMRYIQDRLPGIAAYGNDPSEELLNAAVEGRGIPSDVLDCASTLDLPYPDEAFDAVVETGVLHHVADPARAVAEMLRVARKAVFISDANIYGQGSLLTRLVKLLLSRTHLLTWINRARRHGHDWYFSEGDGVAYSYSAFDAVPQLKRACAQVLVIPTLESATPVGVPLLSSAHVLVCGFKESLFSGCGLAAASPKGER